jgi:hypothetical protein
MKKNLGVGFGLLLLGAAVYPLGMKREAGPAEAAIASTETANHTAALSASRNHDDYVPPFWSAEDRDIILAGDFDSDPAVASGFRFFDPEENDSLGIAPEPSILLVGADDNSRLIPVPALDGMYASPVGAAMAPPPPIRYGDPASRSEPAYGPPAYGAPGYGNVPGGPMGPYPGTPYPWQQTPPPQSVYQNWNQQGPAMQQPYWGPQSYGQYGGCSCQQNYGYGQGYPSWQGYGQSMPFSHGPGCNCGGGYGGGYQGYGMHAQHDMGGFGFDPMMGGGGYGCSMSGMNGCMPCSYSYGPTCCDMPSYSYPCCRNERRGLFARIRSWFHRRKSCGDDYCGDYDQPRRGLFSRLFGWMRCKRDSGCCYGGPSYAMGYGDMGY